MTIREIISEPTPVLRKKAKKVDKVTSEIRRLIDDMVETMRVAPGVGLAANQIGVLHRVITVEYAEEPEQPAPEGAPPPKPALYLLINPEISRASREKIAGIEACLSVPGFAGEVERHTEVVVKGFNPQGAPVRIKAKGWLARIFQHEIDHLDGILYVDRAEKVWEINPGEMEDNV
ncbi:MAG: peptide deformylase [Anaerolineales bacterium]|nr:peptide deformylase [Anaerolineales bacterium]